ncbi:F-box domain-containing protein [Mycena indigotica]|uniref:F-box domain-containing protein n=1 Tax=Mycena indigotica TaxID=2126181 RepID=A0A8H6SF44_9AGAR|nr:F-box domain-containing protein [Mycena indigotica]KAF7297207.1 F-box domain-containing protein [Mycena indigotica]
MTTVQELVGTNAVPTENQILLVKQYLVAPRQEIRSLQETLTELQARLVSTLERRNELKSYIDDHLALSSASRQLPDNVLRCIFRYTMPVSRNASFSMDEGPYLLCRVSKLWRAIAMETPALWSSIHIIIPPGNDSFERVLQTLTLWIERSRTHPLSIHLAYSRTAWRGPSLTPVLSLLVAHAARWHKVHFVTNSDDEVQTFDNLSPENVPLLQHFEISQGQGHFGFSFSNPEPHTQSLNLQFLRTPSLQRLVYHGGFETIPRMMDVSWETLVYLHLGLTATGNARIFYFPFEILRRCTNLEIFKLGLNGIEFKSLPENSPPDLTSLRLPLLTELWLWIDMGQESDKTAEQLFGNCDFPNLAKFTLQTGRIYTLAWLPKLGASAGGLKSVDLTIHAVMGKSLEDALRAMPQLEEIKLSGEPYGEIPSDGSFAWTRDVSVFDALASPDFCPNLQKIELCGIYQVSNAQILTIARRSRNGTLRDFRCHIERPKTMDFREELREELAGGLKLTILVNKEANLMIYTALERTERAPPSPRE